MQKTSAAPKTLRARAYIRVSHVGKRQDTLLSDRMQLLEAKRYADYLGFEFDEQASVDHSDLDVSGFSKKWRQRPGLLAHFEAAKRGEFDVLIFFKISRLARNVREALDLIDAFERVGVSFHFVAEKIDSSSAQGRFLRNVLLSAAEMQSEDSSAFLKSTFLRRALDGKPHGSSPLWIRQTAPATFELIPDQVVAMRRMVDLRMQGMGYVKIAQHMNLEGLKTANGKFWTCGMTFKYLQSSWIETMQGTAIYGRASESPIRIPNIYPAILTADESSSLLALQELYSAEYRRSPVSRNLYMKGPRKNGRYSASTVHLLSGILFCPHCGTRMTPFKRAKGDGAYSADRYACPRAKTQKEMHAAANNYMSAPSVEDAVLRVVRAALVAPPRPFPAKDQPAKRPEALHDLQAKIDRLVTMHLDAKISTDDYNRIYPGLLSEKLELQRRNQATVDSEFQARVAVLAAKDELTREELRQLVHLMVERVEAPVFVDGVTIRKDRTTLRRLARIKLRFPTMEGSSEYFSALYDGNYKGFRRYLAIDGSSEQDYSSLIGEYPRERQCDW